MPLAYLHYDVFTSEPLLGNQLAVFPDARGLDTATMQAIAREMNFAESTFILPAEATGTDIRMRIFTPHVEMPMAGHPTIGSTFALAHLGVIPAGAARFTFGLNIGPTPVDLEWRDGRLAFAWMTQHTPEFGAAVTDRAAVAAALALEPSDLADDLPVQEVSCGVPFLFVPLRDRAAVDRAISDAAAFRRLAGKMSQLRAMFLFAVSPAGSVETVYSRMFAPGLGIVEDPATGSASGPLGCYLVRHRLLGGHTAGAPSATPALLHGRRAGAGEAAPATHFPDRRADVGEAAPATHFLDRRADVGEAAPATHLPDRRAGVGEAAPATRRIISRQGVAMGRASTIHIAIDGSAEAITGVRVGGEAVLVARGELMV